MTPLDPIFKNWRAILLILAGSVLLIAAAYIKGRSDGRAVVQAQLDRANAAFERERGRANELAAERRLQDTLSINRNEQELRDAIASTPDSAPDAVRVRLACERLRRSGQDTARIPACR